MAVITGIDVIGIQRYVFASNRLRDVIAASWMVDHVTSRDALCQWGMAEERILLTAGGNAVVTFDDLAAAREWMRQYSRWLHEKAPGLEVAVAHRDYSGRSLAWGLKALAIDLARAKLERRPGAPQLGLSVTASCSVTGLPAVSLDQEGAPISPQIVSLRKVLDKASQGWNQYLPEQLVMAQGWKAKFPLDMDDLGRSYGETSLIGVVHIDGNGVGQAIQGWLDRCLDNEVNDAQVRTEYRAWSDEIQKLGEHVLRSIIQRVAARIVAETDAQGRSQCFLHGTPYELGFPLMSDSGQTVFLPFRLILFGGDDLTFVCDGRIALDLAVTALREFVKHRIPYLGEHGAETVLTACAGVALVKAHAPFHRSYTLAEDLCRSAKQAHQSKTQHGLADTGCWLDWHIGSTRPSDGIDNVRRREYQAGNLTMRPYPVTAFNGRKESWEWLDMELLGPGSMSHTARRGFRDVPHWAQSRSRVKKLGALVVDGADAVQRQMNAWKVIEPSIALPAGLNESGFIGRQTPLLDAIELMDLHMRLEPDPRAANSDQVAEAAEEAGS
jgi:hypothetical protein